jgi:predicted signal transduction protein with EAL and GGDEF domain
VPVPAAAPSRRHHGWRRWLSARLVTVGVEVVLALVVRLGAVSRYLRGDRGDGTMTALAGRLPDAWFGDAREIGQSLELDQLTFRSALATLPPPPHDVYLSVNATPELLVHPGLYAMLTDDIDVERVIIEVTEHIAIHSYDAIRAALATARERGIRLAVDDTGAVYA